MIEREPWNRQAWTRDLGLYSTSGTTYIRMEVAYHVHKYIPNIFFKIKYIHTYLSRYRTCTNSTYMLLISISLIPTTRIYPCIDGWIDR